MCRTFWGSVVFTLKLNLTFKVEYYSVCVCLGNTPFFFDISAEPCVLKISAKLLLGGFVEYIQNRVLKFCLSVFTVPCVQKVLFTG